MCRLFCALEARPRTCAAFNSQCPMLAGIRARRSHQPTLLPRQPTTPRLPRSALLATVDSPCSSAQTPTKETSPSRDLSTLLDHLISRELWVCFSLSPSRLLRLFQPVIGFTNTDKACNATFYQNMNSALVFTNSKNPGPNGGWNSGCATVIQLHILHLRLALTCGVCVCM